MTPDELRMLADALEPMARAPRFEDFDVPGFCAWVRACADAEPVAWVQSDHLEKARRNPFLARLAPEQLHPDFVPLYLHPAPAAPHPSAEDASRDAYEGCREDLLDWKRRALKAEREARNLAKALADTVNGPTFMGEPAAPQAEPKREPLSDEQIEAQIEARDALLDFISENGTASEGVQHYLDRYVRAALAAKETK